MSLPPWVQAAQSQSGAPPTPTSLPDQQPAANLTPPSVGTALASTAQAVSSNVMGFGVLAGTNALGSAMSGDVEASKLAFLLNLVAQPIKFPRWIDEHQHLPIILFLIACGLLYFFISHDGWKILTTAAQAVLQSMSNYRALGSTATGGILPSTPAANSH